MKIYLKTQILIKIQFLIFEKRKFVKVKNYLDKRHHKIQEKKEIIF